jgi:hypothetical protein
MTIVYAKSATMDRWKKPRTIFFWSCSFSWQCWQSINISLNDSLELPQMITAAKRNFGRPFFFEPFATACWNIWSAFY